MIIMCKRCNSGGCVKNGMMQKKQRYRCKVCGYNFTQGDGRSDYDAATKQMAVRMYLNNCGFRRISDIIEVPLTTVFGWIQRAGQIVDEMVKTQKQEGGDIEILEMDELYTYVKKSQERAKKQGKESANTPAFGLLLIGTQAKMLRLR
jgi:transposase-like protein